MGIFINAITLYFFLQKLNQKTFESIYLKLDSLRRTLPWIETENWLVERSSCAAAGRGPSKARVLERAAVAAGLAARARSAINKQTKIAR